VPRVTLPDGRVVDFPDSMPLEQIEAEAARLSQPDPPPSERPWLDTATSLLPTAGGIAGGIVGGIGGTVAGMGVGGVPGAVGGATLGGAAGESLRQLIDRLRGQEAPGTASEAASRIGMQGAIQGGSELIGAGIAKGATKGAQAVYRGYLKPSLAANKLAKANQVAQTALDEAIPITRGGTAKAQQIIGELRAEVDDLLAKSKGTIDLKRVADRVRAFARRRYFKPGVDTSDYQMALGVADKLDAHPSLKLPPGAKATRIDVPLSAANESKRGLYTSIKEAGFGTPQGAKKSTEKYAAHQLKTGLERVAPAIAPLNARESKLIDAATAIAKAVEREANQYPTYGMKSVVSAGAAGGSYYRGDSPTTALGKGLAVRALLTPGAQSHAAIVASRLSRQLGIGAASAARLAAYVLSEADEEPD
jgi:hypothetical protein